MNDIFGNDAPSTTTYADLTLVKNDDGFYAIEPGLYPVMSDSAEIKKTKDGNGEYLSMKFKIIDGKYEKRFLFSNFNLKNKNPKAVEIGLKQLKGFMTASNAPQKLEGMNGVISSIVGYKAMAQVDIEESEKYGQKNIILGFKPYKQVEADIPM